MEPYSRTTLDICQALETNSMQGLTNKQAAQKLLDHGKNELHIEKPQSIFFLFLSQFNDTLTFSLFGAAVFIFSIGEVTDASIIIGILMFNGVIGTVQEKRTEKMLQGLQTFFKCESFVVREGQQQIIANEFIVPGDLIYLSSGEKVPADARIISSTNLTVDESLLTGESSCAIKSDTVLSKKNIPIAEQENMLFAGTYILTGQATALVLTTGENTETGKIHSAIQSIDTSTPLKKDLEKITHWILIFIAIMCSLLLVIGLATGKPLVDLLVMITALFICVVPEGLPVVLTIICISGAYKMSQRNILVKRIKAIESLGRVDVIITDKTGTLTRNEMIVTKVFVDEESLDVSGVGYHVQGSIENHEKHRTSLDKIAIGCALLNDTHIEFDQTLDTFKIKGNPTQAAAFIFSQKISPDIKTKIQNYKKTHTIPFDTSYKYAAQFYEKDAINTAFVFGASEVVLALCKNNNAEIQNRLDQYLSQGYRVVGVAQKTYSPHDETSLPDHQNIIASDLNFLGFLAMNDEPRENLESVIKNVVKAKIQIIVATGDHPHTALSVAQSIGIVNNSKDIITSKDFEKLNDTEVFNLLKNKNFVCARFLAQDKLRLVNIFKNHGKVVVTTGDGINDVPALVASDVSIAMGSRGAQITKETADIILTRDSFENIIYAIQQGQAIFNALRRAILYFLISNASEVFIIFFALISNIPLPLLPSQILLLNLMTDGFLDAALAMEPIETKNTKISSKKNISIFDASIMYKIIYLALPASVMSLGLFLWFYKTDLALARTLTFTTLIMFQWFNAMNCRSETKSVFKIGLFSNFWLTAATVAILGLQLLVVYAPWMHYVFHTVPISACHWAYAFMVSCTILIAEELRKFMTK